MSLVFQKISGSAKHVALKWTTTEGSSEISHELESDEAPRPEFVKALGAFLGFVLRICELTPKYGDGMEVTSLSISRNAKSGRLGLVITAKKPVAQSNSPFLIHTPHLSEASESEDGAGAFMVGMADCLDAAIEEATAYINGVRAQVDMFAEGVPAAKPALEVTTGNGGQTGDRSIARGRGGKKKDAPALVD